MIAYQAFRTYVRVRRKCVQGLASPYCSIACSMLLSVCKRSKPNKSIFNYLLLREINSTTRKKKQGRGKELLCSKGSEMRKKENKTSVILHNGGQTYEKEREITGMNLQASISKSLDLSKQKLIQHKLMISGFCICSVCSSFVAASVADVHSDSLNKRFVYSITWIMKQVPSMKNITVRLVSIRNTIIAAFVICEYDLMNMERLSPLREHPIWAFIGKSYEWVAAFHMKWNTR